MARPVEVMSDAPVWWSVRPERYPALMGINIELREEDGELIETGGIVEWRELPAFDDPRYPYLRLVDPIGDTVFSAYQCQHAVLAEVERFAHERPSPNVDRLAGLVRRCSGDMHTYLWFIGD